MESPFFNEDAFKLRVQTALDQVRKILDVSRAPTYASNVPHEYTDKYILAGNRLEMTLRLAVLFTRVLMIVSDLLVIASVLLFFPVVIQST